MDESWVGKIKYIGICIIKLTDVLIMYLCINKSIFYIA